MEWMVFTIGYCVVSALVPVFSTEVYLVGLAIAQPQLHWGWLALTAAIGQLIGKIVFYYAGRKAPTLPFSLHRGRDQQRAGHWAHQLHRLRDSLQQNPKQMTTVLLVSALTGLPPFAATSALAGLARLPLLTFVVTGLTGRFTRFAAIAASPGLLTT